MHCEGPGVADWFKESTITTRNLYSFSLLKCSPLQPGERSLLGQSPASVSGGEQNSCYFKCGREAHIYAQILLVSRRCPGGV